MYRIGTLIYNSAEVERINKNEFLYINASPLTKPTETRPVFVANASGYRVYGSLIVRSSNSTLNGAVSSSATINISAANPSISIGNIATIPNQLIVPTGVQFSLATNPVSVITWNPIPPGVNQVWVPVDPDA